MALPEELDLAGLSVQFNQPEPIRLAAPWQALKPDKFASSADSQMKLLDDGSLLIAEGHGYAGEVYTVEFTTDVANIEAIALEALAHESLPRFGPGRNEGLFVLAEMDIHAAAENDIFTRIEVADHQASYGQQNMPAANVFDGNLSTGWGISPHRNTDHVLVANLKKRIENPGKTRLKIELRHHKDVAASLGRFRIWVKAGLPAAMMADAAKPAPPQPAPSTEKPAPATATTTKPAAPAKPAPAKPATPPKPTIPPRLEGVEFPPRYIEGVAMTDAGYWHTLDVRHIKTSSGATFTRTDNGELLGEGPDDDGTYTITAFSPLQRITGFRLDCLPNATLVNKGPGRKGDFAISKITISATPLPGGSPAELTLTNARSSPGSPAANTSGPFTDGADKTWPDKHNANGHQLYFDPASPIESTEGFLLTIRIDHAAKKPLGCFRLSATSNKQPAKTPPTIAWQKPLHATQFVPIPIASVTAAEGTKCEVLEDGTVLLAGRPLDTIEFTAALKLPKTTALKLLFLPHESLAPSPGPGRQSNGTFAVLEMSMHAGPSPDKLQPLVINAPVTDHERPPHLLERAFDGNPATFWRVEGPRGETRTVVLPLASPLQPGASTQLVGRMRQMAVGRFQLLATSSTDPAVLSATPPPAEAPAADAPPTPPARR
jgi:hypothetical protein